MKLAFSTLGCPDWDLETIISKAEEYEYEGIEIRGVLRRFDLTKVPELTKKVSEIRKLLESHGISIACVSASSRFSSPDADERKANLISAKAHMDIARSFNAPYIRVFGGEIPDGVERGRCEDYIAESLKELGKYAEDVGVKVTIETHDSFSTGKHLAAVLDKVDHPMIGALWDIHHPVKNGEPPEDTMRYLSGRVFHVHVKDGDFTRYTMLGEGKVPTLKILRLLKEEGYDGYLSVEWEKAWHPELPDPDVALPQYARKLRQYLSQIGE
ncbi:TPA: sugar phosphate isomerase/epimerase [Candidatus Poribacteria bacterium]|nr:sugar phosphate isomerase/epimerase [Candidatus Poribacteria bacterium]